MPVELTPTIYPVCLPEISDDPEHLAGEPAIVIGYGPHNNGTSLNKANQRVYQEEYCSDRYSLEDADSDSKKLIKAELPNGFDDTTICSGNRRASEGTCRGDSGGPLLIDKYVDGEFITIQNGILHGSLQSCSNQKYPAIFSRLSHPVIHNWLFSNLIGVTTSTPRCDLAHLLSVASDVTPIGIKGCGLGPLKRLDLRSGPLSSLQSPWTASIVLQPDDDSNRTSLRCSGSILDEKFVLTSANCVVGDFAPEIPKMTVIVGA